MLWSCSYIGEFNAKHSKFHLWQRTAGNLIICLWNNFYLRFRVAILFIYEIESEANILFRASAIQNYDGGHRGAQSKCRIYLNFLKMFLKLISYVGVRMFVNTSHNAFTDSSVLYLYWYYKNSTSNIANCFRFSRYAVT